MIKFLLLFIFSITAINAQMNSLCCIGDDINHESMLSKTATSTMEHCDHHEENEDEDRGEHHCVLKCCSGVLLFTSEIKSQMIISYVKTENTFYYKDQKTQNYHIKILRPPISLS
jgi:hypothetical protein